MTSLPDVLTSLSQREVRWSRVILSWGALAAAALHNIALGWDFLALNYSCNLPSTLQVSWLSVRAVGVDGGTPGKRYCVFPGLYG